MRLYKKKSLTRGHPSLDDNAEAESQELIIDKLYSPSCFSLLAQSLKEMTATDQLDDNPHLWIDDPFSIRDLETAIAFSRKNFAPGLDQIDYTVIRSFSHSFQLIQNFQ